MEQYTKLQIIRILIGEINSVGDSYEDAIRLKNLKEFKEIILELIQDLIDESRKNNRPQWSHQESGLCALTTLSDIRMLIADELDVEV